MTTTAPRALEADCQATIVAAASMAGWLVHAERPAQHRSGRWGTPLQGHPGFPDLVLVHARRHLLVFAELKRRPNVVEPRQQSWLGALSDLAHEYRGGVHAGVWWVPEQLDEITAWLTDPTGPMP